jgi:hypothetical protein
LDEPLALPCQRRLVVLFLRILFDLAWLGAAARSFAASEIAEGLYFCPDIVLVSRVARRQVCRRRAASRRRSSSLPGKELVASKGM